MKCIVGIEGGGTKSILKIVDFDNNLIHEKLGKSTNLSSNSYEDVYSNIKELFIDIPSNVEIALISIGSAGQAYFDELERILLEVSKCNNIILHNDIEIALKAEGNYQNKILLISGTGSICLGENSKKKTFRTGGWGEGIGDEGSAYYIGKQAINMITKMEDKRVKKSILYDNMFAELKVSSINDLLRMYFKDLNKTKIAKLALVVEKSFKEKDKTAKLIFNEAVNDLYNLFANTYENLKLTSLVTVVLLSGAVLDKNEYIAGQLSKKIMKNHKNVLVKKLDAIPVDGAILFGFEALGVKING